MDLLPLTNTLAPRDVAEIADVVRACQANGVAIYPIGGGASLEFGLPAKKPGVGLSLAGLNQIVDYPARDLTITVDAGVTMRAIAEAVGRENQWLPLDVPRAGEATAGGVAATNWSGPRRAGYGGARDYIIGVSAVDGRGAPFRGGGRVVKNVAGYDFCKLLAGSLGALGVITRVTFRLRPKPAATGLLACAPIDPAHTERLLADLTRFPATPAAIELLGGPEWRDDFDGAARSGDLTTTNATKPGEATCGAADPWRLVVGFEGEAADVAWALAELQRQWRAAGARHALALRDQEAAEPWRRLAEFAALPCALALKINVPPSHVTRMLERVTALDPRASFQAHAGNGVIIARLSAAPRGGLARALLADLRPAAVAAQGTVVVLANATGEEMTPQVAWGGAGPLALMNAVRRRFDPHNLFNPGRFTHHE